MSRSSMMVSSCLLRAILPGALNRLRTPQRESASQHQPFRRPPVWSCGPREYPEPEDCACPTLCNIPAFPGQGILNAVTG
jgi:hypothetical protein